MSDNQPEPATSTLMEPRKTPTAAPSRSVRQRLTTWYWAARPFTLSGFLAPVLVGSALAFHDKPFSWLVFALVLIASLLVQVGANLVDEYSDHDRPEGGHKLIAPHKVIARGALTSREVKHGAAVVFAVATLIGLYLALVSGWLTLALAVASAAVAYFYSGGPKPLGTLGFGQPLVFVFMGPVLVIGAYYVQTRAVTPEAFLLSLPVACTVTAILAANDLRDLEEDRAAGKRTVVTAFGLRFARWELTALVAAAFLLIIALVGLRVTGVWAMLSLLALPQAYAAMRRVWVSQSRPERAEALKATSKLHAVFGILLAVGVAVG